MDGLHATFMESLDSWSTERMAGWTKFSMTGIYRSLIYQGYPASIGIEDDRDRLWVETSKCSGQLGFN